MGSIDGPECQHGVNAFDPRGCGQCTAEARRLPPGKKFVKSNCLRCAEAICDECATEPPERPAGLPPMAVQGPGAALVDALRKPLPRGVIAFAPGGLAGLRELGEPGPDDMHNTPPTRPAPYHKATPGPKRPIHDELDPPNAAPGLFDFLCAQGFPPHVIKLLNQGVRCECDQDGPPNKSRCVPCGLAFDSNTDVIPPCPRFAKPAERFAYGDISHATTEEWGVIRVARWPEGIVLWVGGEIKWKSWKPTET